MRYRLMMDANGHKGPAIAGTRNQTDLSDLEASTFSTRHAAEDAFTRGLGEGWINEDVEVWIEKVSDDNGG